MSEPLPEGLDVHVVRRIHASLTLDVAIRLGREIGVVFGPSGAGKTTLLRLIAGLTSPDAGLVRLDGATLFDAERRIVEPLRRRRVGMIFQDDCLFPHLNAGANIRFGLKSWPRDQADARLAEVAALCGVERLLDRRPATLSGGERQRVGLARALAPRPRLLLCDEPVSALDLANRDALIERLRDVQRTLAIPMLYVTHSPAEAIALGSRLFLLEAGRIVAEGPPLDVLSRNRNPQRGPFPWEALRNVFPRPSVHPICHEAHRTDILVGLDDQEDDGDRLMSTMVATEPEVLLKTEVTPEELLAMPDGGHYELIDGELRERGVSFLSNLVAAEVSGILRDYCRPRNLGWVLAAELGYRCFPWKPKRIRRADVAFFRADRVTKERLSEGFCSIAPDLAVEVVSPNDLIEELDEKVEEYLRAGVKLIWVVRPGVNAVQVFRADGSESWLRAADELSGEDVIPGFRCRVEAFFPKLDRPEEQDSEPKSTDAAG